LRSAEEEKKKKYVESCEKRHTTFTPLVMSVDGIFATQMKVFVKVLAERLGEKNGMDYGRMLNYTRTRIQMSIIRAAGMCIRGTRRRFKSGESLLGID